jgi:hypothetical protein
MRGEKKTSAGTWSLALHNTSPPPHAEFPRMCWKDLRMRNTTVAHTVESRERYSRNYSGINVSGDNRRLKDVRSSEFPKTSHLIAFGKGRYCG